MPAVIVTHALHQKNSGGKAEHTGIGMNIKTCFGVEYDFIRDSTTKKYGELWLRTVIEVLTALYNEKRIVQDDQINFITGFKTLCGMSNLVMKTLTKLLSNRVTDKADVDQEHYVTTRWERKANHELYVEVLWLCVLLDRRGVTVNFNTDIYKSKVSSDLWSDIRDKVDPHYEAPKGKAPSLRI